MSDGEHDPNRRVALVTGAASGIGAAIAAAMAEADYDLLLHTGSNADGLDSVAETARATGVQVHAVTADLVEPNAAANIIADARKHFGKLDVLIHNAGYADFTRFDEVGPTQTHRAFDVMPGAFLSLVQAAREELTNSTVGRIVAVSSFVAHRYHLGGDTFAASAAAKAALESMVRSAAVELAPAGVTVNAVAPGYIRKDSEIGWSAEQLYARRTGAERIALRRVGLPEDVAPGGGVLGVRGCSIHHRATGACGWGDDVVGAATARISSAPRRLAWHVTGAPLAGPSFSLCTLCYTSAPLPNSGTTDTNEVIAETRGVRTAVRRTHEPGVGAPRPAADNAPAAGLRWAERIGHRVSAVIPLAIGAPLIDVAQHIVQSPIVWILLADRFCLMTTIAVLPSDVVQRWAGWSATARCRVNGPVTACPAGVFPLRLGRELQIECWDDG